MKAAMFHGAGDIRIEEVPNPVPGSGEVLIQPRYCGICGTDLSAWKYGLYGSGVIIGHEFSGEIIGLGPDVGSWSIGDRIVANSTIPCKKCTYCLEGKFVLCDTSLEMPGITINGGMAEQVVLPAEALHSLPDNMSWEEGALVEPLAVALHGFNLIDFKVGQSVLILGAGAIGLLAIKIAQIGGATSIAVSEPNNFRRNLVSELGSFKINNPAQTNVSIAFADQFDLVIECTGLASVVAETFSLVRKGGTILVLGIPDDPVEADFTTAVLNELTIKFSYCGFSEFPTAIKLISNQIINVKDLITNRIKLEEVVLKGFQELMKPETKNLKILVEI
ncbi:MAG: zinc-binding dehydrogenase [Candidatus Hermodarchaeota archaeon]